MLRNARLVVGLCVLGGVSVAALIAWTTGFLTGLVDNIVGVWDQVMVFIDGLSVNGLLAGAGAGVGMLVIILVVIMAITDNWARPEQAGAPRDCSPGLRLSLCRLSGPPRPSCHGEFVPGLGGPVEHAATGVEPAVDAA